MRYAANVGARCRVETRLVRQLVPEAGLLVVRPQSDGGRRRAELAGREWDRHLCRLTRRQIMLPPRGIAELDLHGAVGDEVRLPAVRLRAVVAGHLLLADVDCGDATL